MTILIAPDSFKGTLSAAEVCEIIAAAFRETIPQAQPHGFPLADGGEGMVAAWHAVLGGALHYTNVSGPYGETVRAAYLMLDDATAVLELAACAGLELARPRGLNPERTSTRGLGELLLCAKAEGARRIILGLGGSATNDAGCGMAHALGWRFVNAQGEDFCPTGGTLRDITQVLPPQVPFGIPVTAACDVENPLHGPKGAAFVYAAQKGADTAMIQRLDAGLRHVASITPDPSCLIPDSCGTGAAGGVGFGVMKFLGGILRPGIDLLLDQTNFTQLLARAALVVTGEGRMDAQTLQGKAPFGVLARAQAAGVPVIGVCGCVDDTQALLDAGFAALYPAVTSERSLGELRKTCREDLYRSAKQAADGHISLFTQA